MPNHNGLLTRTGTRLLALFAVVIATAGLMLAGGATPALAVAGITVTPTSGLVTTEAGGTATFTVVLNDVPTASVTIALSSSNTAEGTVSPASLLFTTGNWNVAQLVTVTGVNDLVDDGNVVYSIVTGPVTGGDAGYNAINPPDVSVTNNDDDPSQLQFSGVNFPVLEGNSGPTPATFTVTRTGDVTVAASVTWTATSGGVSPATANVDFVSPATGTLNWTAGGSQSGTVTIFGDTTVEADETITITLTAPSGAVIAGSSTATITILNDDSVASGGTIQFSQATYTVSEGVSGGNALVSVTRTGGTSGGVTATCSTQISGSSAVTPADYTAVVQVLTWAGGDGASKNCSIPIVADGAAEPTETVILNLTLPTGGATLGSPAQATLFITDTSLPAITSLSPSFGPIGGTNTITISGANFNSASFVFFGTSPGVPPTTIADNGSSLTVVVPFSSTVGAQTVEVVVRTPVGDSSTVGTSNDYAYVGGPTVTGLSITTGPTTGGTVGIVITGTGFTPTGMTVAFGGTLAIFTYNSPTSITAVSPAHCAGLTDVIVTTLAGSSPNTTADDFTYTGTAGCIPTVTSV
ncbi:MAG: Calx-beta domain-containing protein, partial [Tepidiformaceae bacterium]